MGVRGLDSFVRDYVPGGYERINIIDEIDKIKMFVIPYNDETHISIIKLLFVYNVKKLKCFLILLFCVFSETNTSEPCIIFDLGGVVHSISSYAAFYCGGRYNVFLKTIEQFFSRLHEQKIKLIVFSDGRVQTRNDDYMGYETGLRLLESGQNLSSLDLPCGKKSAYYGKI